MNNGKKTILMLVSNGSQQATTIILLYFLARILNKSDYATFSQGDLIVKTLIPIFIIGIPITISIYLSKINCIKQELVYIRNSTKILLLCGIAGSILLILFGNNIAKAYNNSELNSYRYLLSFYLFFEIQNSITPNFLIVTNQNKKLAIYTIIISILKVTLIMIVLLMVYLVYYLFVVLVIVSLIKYTYLKYQIYIRYKSINTSEISKEFKRSELKAQFLFAIIIGFTQIIGKISDLLDRNMVSWLFTPTEYAVFANGAMEVPFIGLVAGSISAIFLPEFTRLVKSKDDLIILEKWKYTIVISAVFILPIMFVLFLFKEGFITMIYSSRYLESTSIFQIYLLKIPAALATYSTLLLAKGKNKIIMYNTLFALVLNIVLNLLLMKLLGIKGAAIATVISFYFLAFLQLFQITKSYHIKFAKAFPFKEVIIICFVGMLTYVTFYFIKLNFSFTNIINLVIYGSLMYFANLILLNLLGIIKLKESIIQILSKER